MDIYALGEGFLEHANSGHMGEQPEFDLGIVHREQFVTRRGHEGAADMAAFLSADGNVLQVGVAGGEPAGGGGGHGKRGMDAASFGIDLAHQGIGVGALELGQLAPVENPPR